MTNLYFSESYLDTYQNVDSKFISQLIRGDKSCFKNSEIHQVAVPFYSELNMQNLINQVKDDAAIKRYLHDDFATKKKPSRQFLFNIIGTVYPDFFKQLIESQTQARFDRQASDKVGDHILATDEWVSALA